MNDIIPFLFMSRTPSMRQPSSFDKDLPQIPGFSTRSLSIHKRTSRWVYIWFIWWSWGCEIDCAAIYCVALDLLLQEWSFVRVRNCIGCIAKGNFLPWGKLVSDLWRWSGLTIILTAGFVVVLTVFGHKPFIVVLSLVVETTLLSSNFFLFVFDCCFIMTELVSSRLRMWLFLSKILR